MMTMKVANEGLIPILWNKTPSMGQYRSLKPPFPGYENSLEGSLISESLTKYFSSILLGLWDE